MYGCLWKLVFYACLCEHTRVEIYNYVHIGKSVCEACTYPYVIRVVWMIHRVTGMCTHKHTLLALFFLFLLGNYRASES